MPNRRIKVPPRKNRAKTRRWYQQATAQGWYDPQEARRCKEAPGRPWGGWDKDKVRLAKKMLKYPTRAERAMWGVLKRMGLQRAFKRQFILCGYIADFYSEEYRLVIEVDGYHHFTPEGAKKDARRDAALERVGITTVRFPNHLPIKKQRVVMDRLAVLTHTKPTS